MTKVFCDDRECFYYDIAGCGAGEVHHSDERFCVTGRRKERDCKELMNNFNPGCNKTSAGYKSKHIKVIK